jgi:hypothetical protein
MPVLTVAAPRRYLQQMPPGLKGQLLRISASPVGSRGRPNRAISFQG